MDYNEIKIIVESWFEKMDSKYEIDHFREFLQCLAEDEADKRIEEIK